MKPFAIAFSLLLYTFLVAAQNNKPFVGPLPKWITLNETAVAPDSLLAEAEDGVLYLAYEKQVNPAANTTFYKAAIQMRTQEGVEANSEITVNFDPSYQKLIWHHIVIRRGNSRINQLQVSRQKLMQQESDRAKHLYDGSLSAVQILADVRKGDIVEYAYSLAGRNPILGNLYTGTFDLQFSIPVAWLYYKIVVPPHRQVQFVNRGNLQAPTFNKQEGMAVYEWKAANLMPLRTNNNIPYWYDPYPVTMISEYKNWEQVVDWALPLYAVSTSATDNVSKLATTIKKQHTSDLDRLLAALRFVQDEVRYMGFEMGEGSYRPHTPQQVLENRYGDCKDKVFLLCRLLHDLGIAAYPVLVNSGKGKVLNQMLPAPTVFDHVVITAQVNGKTYYFDPTISNQRGAVDDIYFPDYGYGLIVRAGTKQLSALPRQKPAKVEIVETFEVHNLQGEASLSVITKSYGSAADELRTKFGNDSNREIQGGYTKFYQQYFKNITPQSLTFANDSITGMVTTTEKYKIEDFWGEVRNLKKATLEPFVITNLVSRPDNNLRTAPFALGAPVNCNEKIIINLPEPWEFHNDKIQLDHEAFSYKAQYKGIGSRVELVYNFQGKKDHVTTAEFNSYKKAIKKLDEQIGYTLTYSIEDATASGSAVGLLSGYFPYWYIMLGLSVFITYQWKKRR
ncbi:Transglutaminase-like superfamily protein [Cnuella takakiae]|uniref:Transglutaminase-like superfamily protein n=1 Tax=Cnuella takakiae TaxID=1302690 RepID=A0A1M5GPV0_9BACT|nr:DUF3857 domain-containing protein [Cnuella takakiae]OLY90931.1 hypothetical protein BUE76_02725 [Cnuella takakiae]SHG05779.1 Transglutaminase-like superfamily protein [Cnuella takakiae]